MNREERIAQDILSSIFYYEDYDEEEGQPDTLFKYSKETGRIYYDPKCEDFSIGDYSWVDLKDAYIDRVTSLSNELLKLRCSIED